MNRFIAAGILTVALATTAAAQGQPQKIEKGKTVKFDYTLTVDGKVVDISAGKKPIEYTQGSGQIIKGLETRLQGLKVSDEKTILVPAAEGYGPVVPNAVQAFPKTFFPKDVQLKVGMTVPLQNKEGQVVPAVVKEIKAEEVLLDLNHPLAGKDLTFAIKIVEIK